LSLLHQLKSVSIFSSLSERELYEIESYLIGKKYLNGEMVFSSYETARGVFILTEGKVKLYKAFKGKEQTLRIFTPISMLGEAGAFKGEHYPANAIAIENSYLFFLETGNLIKIIERYPKISLKMLGILSERLYHLVNLVENLTLKDAVSRVYEYIKQKTDEKKEVLFKTTLVAMELGLTVETVSRAISTLKKSGKIEKIGKIIKVNR